MQIGKYATIVFDCDGVLIDANTPKVNAFVSAMPDGVSIDARQEFSCVMSRNFGKPRQWLLDTFEQMFPDHSNVDIIAKLLKKYSSLVSQGYLEWPLTEGSESFLQTIFLNKALYVASGSNQDELRQVFQTRGLRSYFQEIYGGPVSKHQNLQTIRAVAAAPALFVGDSIVDYESAEKAGGYDFIFYTPYSIDKENVISFAEKNNIPLVHSYSEFTE